MKKYFMTAILLASLTATGCNAVSVQKPALQQISAGLTANASVRESRTISQAFPAAQAEFSANLFRSCANGETMLISPLSVSLALAMTANGANGETLAQMEQTLGGLPLTELNASLSKYTETLPSMENSRFSMANSIWFRDVQDSLHISPTFLQNNTDYYSADLFKAPFDDGTCKDINAWVDEKTEHMIPNIIDRIGADTRVYLINALTFDAKWQEEYQNSQIHTTPFHGKNGDKDVQMLYSTESAYLESSNATGFLKPYKGGAYSFAVIVPDETITVDEYIAGLDGPALQEILTPSYQYEVYAGVPEFQVDYGVSLKETLKAMGMPLALTEGVADFSHMSEEGLFISDVIHKTHIEVDAHGTKAAAATIVSMEDNCCEEIQETRTVIADRPFVYMIIDNQEHLPIFIGVQNDI